MQKQRIAYALLAATLLASPIDSRAAGFYNMPTNLRQCLGVGFGPGYHAPLLLGNPMRAGTEAKPIKWLPHGLAPPTNNGFAAAPTVWTAGCDNCQAEAGSWMGYTSGSDAHSGSHASGESYFQASPAWPSAGGVTSAAPILVSPEIAPATGEVIPAPMPSR